VTAQLLQVEALAKHYPVSTGFLRPKALVRALDGVSFRLDAGKTLAVVGESGCGKTTLARQITMIEIPTSGLMRLDGTDIASASPQTLKLMRPQVQMVFQNPYASLNPRKRVGTILEEPLIIHTPLTPAERAEKARAMMARVGLRPEHYSRYPHMFSGGQRQRIAIARALMTKPRLVVADEPVSALDVSIQAQVLNLLMDLQQETGVAFIFVSHNLAVVEHIADEVLVMYLGRVVEQGPKRMIFDSPRHPYTRALLSATPRVDLAQRKVRFTARGELPSPLNPPPGCSFHQRCPHAIEICRIDAPELREVGAHLTACHRAGEI
jgi:dipeptide transport system ATP-binding protein